MPKLPLYDPKTKEYEYFRPVAKKMGTPTVSIKKELSKDPAAKQRKLNRARYEDRKKHMVIEEQV